MNCPWCMCACVCVRVGIDWHGLIVELLVIYFVLFVCCSLVLVFLFYLLLVVCVVLNSVMCEVIEGVESTSASASFWKHQRVCMHSGNRCANQIRCENMGNYRKEFGCGFGNFALC